MTEVIVILFGVGVAGLVMGFAAADEFFDLF